MSVTELQSQKGYKSMMERRRIGIFGHKTKKNKQKLFPPIELVIFVGGQSDNCHPLYQLPLQGTGAFIRSRVEVTAAK